MKYFLASFCFLVFSQNALSCSISSSNIVFAESNKTDTNEAVFSVSVDCPGGTNYAIVKRDVFMPDVLADNGTNNGAVRLVLTKENNSILTANEIGTAITGTSNGTVQHHTVKAFLSANETISGPQKSGNVNYSNQLFQLVNTVTNETYISNFATVTGRIFGACAINSSGNFDLGTITVEQQNRSIEKHATLSVLCDDGMAYKLYGDNSSSVNAWSNNTISPIAGVSIDFSAMKSGGNFTPISKTQYISSFGETTYTNYDFKSVFLVSAGATGSFSFSIMPTVVF